MLLFLLRPLLFLGLSLSPAVIAQEPVIKTTTRLVQLSVIAKSHDQPAEGLTQDDFKVFVDGHQQKISFFSAISAAASQPTAPATPAGSNTFSNLAASKEQAANAVTVVLLDLVNTKLTDRLFAQQQLIKYLQSIPPTDRVAVYTFNGRLRVLHDYTSSMELFQQRLAAANGQVVSVVNTEPAGAIDSSEAATFASLINGGGSAEERAFYMRNRVLGTLNVLKFIAAHLANVPGRKNLVWLSEAFPLRIGVGMSKFSEDFADEFEATVRALSDANIAVYPVDARGLTTPELSDASRSAPPSGTMPSTGKNPRPPKASASDRQNATQATMQELAQSTGGHAFYNTNDLSRAIHQAVEDSALTYTLGFYPEEEKQDREFHKLKVEASKPHINLHYRNGYLDLAEVPRDERARSIQLHDSLWSPLDATEIGITLQLSHPANALNIAVSLDSKGIHLEPKADRHSGRVDILTAQFSKDGSVLGTPTIQTLELNMLDGTYRKFLTEGLHLNDPVNIYPGANTLRVIVRDYGSGMIGSVTVPLSASL
jgi:VWFA-related protein